MSNESPEISPASSPKSTRQDEPRAAYSDRQKQSSRNRSRSASASYKAFRRDILYRTINEFQLSGRKVNAYSDLLSHLRFDLLPVVSEGETWYRCRGKTVNDRPCRRLIPEVYLRNSIGKVIATAERFDLKGDNLIEELAESLSYAICSEHNPNVHKIARAIECLPMIQEYRREQQPPELPKSASIREESPAGQSDIMASVEEQIREALARAPSLDRNPRPKAWRTGSAPNPSGEKEDTLVSYEQAEMVKVQRHYRDYIVRSTSIRASSRGRRRLSDASSTASPIEKPAEQRWKALEKQGS